MQSLINQLLQLQELVLILDEHRATGDGSHLTRLTQNVEAMAEGLPIQIKGFVQRLLKKDHIVMAPMHNGSCAICGMRLPISQVQAVKQAKDMQTCPSCARILYEPLDAARWVGEVHSRSEPRKAGIARFTAPVLMVPNLKAANRDDAILELANAMQDARFIDDAGKLVTAALEREAILSTAVENGLAFPHVRGVEGGGLTLALGTSEKGVKFDDEHTARIIFFMAIPTAVSAFYLRLVAGLSEAFLKPANRTGLLAATTQDQLWKALTKATRYTVK
ncbi:MAG: PTS sugar transporter subunit IIA [Kiritimatiellae bacterium]|nr:PTS sugar transporter subunit IIA [Kiritimatiellia bacterium]